MMAIIELPKDAEGREIPLDVEFLYNANGESVKPCSFTFVPYDGFGWEMNIVGAPNLVYDPKSFYLTQPDSWKKLLEDLDAAGDARYQEACAYFHRNKDEDGCTSCPGGEDGCARIAMRDIASRIRKLRGED